MTLYASRPVRVESISDLRIEMYPYYRQAALLNPDGSVLAQASTDPHESGEHLAFRLLEVALAEAGAAHTPALAVRHGVTVTTVVDGQLVSYQAPRIGADSVLELLGDRLLLDGVELAVATDPSTLLLEA